jgi:hypothetical protein
MDSPWRRPRHFTGVVTWIIISHDKSTSCSIFSQEVLFFLYLGKQPAGRYTFMAARRRRSHADSAGDDSFAKRKTPPPVGEFCAIQTDGKDIFTKASSP